MILYRLQTFLTLESGESTWANEWFPLASEGDKALKRARDQELQARLDRLDIPTGREALCELLNLSDANYMNLEGELVGRSP